MEYDYLEMQETHCQVYTYFWTTLYYKWACLSWLHLSTATRQNLQTFKPTIFSHTHIYGTCIIDNVQYLRTKRVLIHFRGLFHLVTIVYKPDHGSADLITVR